MTAHSVVQRAFDGSHIDGSWFTSVTDIAHRTAWLNGAAEIWTNLGLGVFALLMVAGWWSARRADARTMALALAAPVSVAVAFLATELVKNQVAELRPCRSLPHSFIIESCPAPTDYAFPSGHSTVAAAAVAALFLLDRRLSAVAALFAVIEGASRVYVGAHYPHDVAGSFLVGLVVALLTSLALRRLGAPLVDSLRSGPLRPLLAAEPADLRASR